MEHRVKLIDELLWLHFHKSCPACVFLHKCSFLAHLTPAKLSLIGFLASGLNVMLNPENKTPFWISWERVCIEKRPESEISFRDPC